MKPLLNVSSIRTVIAVVGMSLIVLWLLVGIKWVILGLCSIFPALNPVLDIPIGTPQGFVITLGLGIAIGIAPATGIYLGMFKLLDKIKEKDSKKSELSK